MKPIPYGRHWLDEEDLDAVIEALRSEWITQGPRIEALERAVAERCGARFGVAFSSGTAALHAACFVAGLGPQEEAVTTPLTFVATANVVVYLGGKPVFSDVDPETLNLDPKRLPQRITSRTRLLLPVHFAGLPCDMEAIGDIARRKGLRVVEDACHALGAEWVTREGRRERVGSCSHSEMTVFSFHPVKHITTGEGGMVLTNRPEFVEHLRSFRHHGLVKLNPPEPGGAQMQRLGYNYRITDFQCALGLAQMGKLDRFLDRRAQIAAAYTQAFQGLGLELQAAGNGRHAWHLYAVRLPLEQLRASRKEIFSELQARGVGVNVHYRPVHLQPFYQQRFGCARGDHPISERYFDRAVTLPLFPKMTDAEVDFVIHSVRSALERFHRPPPAVLPSDVPSRSGREA